MPEGSVLPPTQSVTHPEVPRTNNVNPILFLILTITFLASTIFLAWQNYQLRKQLAAPQSYAECLKAPGSLVQESYPATCVTAEGKRFTQPATDEEKQNLLPPDSTTNWKTYTNTKYGYQISYPNDWKFTETDDPGRGDGPLSYTTLVSSILPLKDSGSINIAISRDLTWDEFKKNAKEQGYLDYKFNGIEAIIFDKPEFDKQISFNSPTNKVITISYSYGPGNSAQATIDQILSTFKFLEQ